MVRAAIIIVGFAILVVILAAILIGRYRRRAELDPFNSILENHIDRLQYLEKSMDRLFRRHQVIDKLSDAYDLIPKYADCKDQAEEDYCRDYLQKKYSSAYNRMDVERLE